MRSDKQSQLKVNSQQLGKLISMEVIYLTSLFNVGVGSLHVDENC
jgi:hypothetical protein